MTSWNTPAYRRLELVDIITQASRILYTNHPRYSRQPPQTFAGILLLTIVPCSDIYYQVFNVDRSIADARVARFTQERRQCVCPHCPRYNSHGGRWYNIRVEEDIEPALLEILDCLIVPVASSLRDTECLRHGTLRHSNQNWLRPFESGRRDHLRFIKK
ncbi:hypothetical protein OE88DRAFT_1135673 [Heliocybe sulcata]|uniref:Uncharacterized protein n=1 Tax=Heliocybe sulcata TaxID=5364 RepID=A0A5C3NC16_9AGAM|nr:hypothetical protein OE88DRAFT_1135673 [Heliocybe sulcata]